jgi:hypothetical protein
MKVGVRVKVRVSAGLEVMWDYRMRNQCGGGFSAEVEVTFDTHCS